VSIYYSIKVQAFLVLPFSEISDSNDDIEESEPLSLQ